MNKVEMKKILDNAPNGAYWFIGIHPHGYCNELGDFHSSGVGHGFTYCNLSDEVWESMICLGDLMVEMEAKTQTKEVEWENGDKCVYMNYKDLHIVIGYDNEIKDAVWCKSLRGDLNLLEAKHLSKPETPEAKKEREELEAAYDLYVSWNNALGHESVRHISTFKNDDNYALFRFFTAKQKNLL